MIDYSKYSLEELFEVKKTIDPNSPNYLAFNNELEKRQSEFEQSQSLSETKQYNSDNLKIKTVGFFQLFSAAVLIFIILYNSFFGSGIAFLTLAIATPLIALNGIAGFTAFMQLSKWYWLSVFNLFLQLFSVSIGSYFINYAGLGYINVLFSWGQEFSLGFDAQFSPGFAFYKYKETLNVQSVGIDVLAIIFLLAFVRVKDYEARA